MERKKTNRFCKLQNLKQEILQYETFIINRCKNVFGPLVFLWRCCEAPIWRFFPLPRTLCCPLECRLWATVVRLALDPSFLAVGLELQHRDQVVAVTVGHLAIFSAMHTYRPKSISKLRSCRKYTVCLARIFAKLQSILSKSILWLQVQTITVANRIISAVLLQF